MIDLHRRKALHQIPQFLYTQKTRCLQDGFPSFRFCKSQIIRLKRPDRHTVRHTVLIGQKITERMRNVCAAGAVSGLPSMYGRHCPQIRRPANAVISL